ncbi:MAG: LLM class F420-dependent oxidoreductase [Candidatus Binataceae bacterium]
MADFGIATVPTHDSIPPPELGQWVEAHRFESLWFGEHSHIPTSCKTPSPLGGELPELFKQFYDPFVALTAAAVVTTKLKVGTGVCLVPEHHTINLAKAIATLDRISNGRVVFGIGGGWNAEEMADHGVELQDRWQVTRERILAMREIWTKDVAEYHGKFVNFDPIWCWPKPVQAGGPPVLIGAASKWVPQRVAEYCDGWFPIDGGYDLAGGIAAIRAEVARRGRSADALDFSIQTTEEFAPGGLENRIPELIKLGFKRIVFLIMQTRRDEQWPLLERYAALIRQFT